MHVRRTTCALRRAHFPPAFRRVLFLRPPFRSRALVFFPAAVTPVINFAEFGSTHRVREAHVRNRRLTSEARKSCLYNLAISLMKYCNITEFCHKHVSVFRRRSQLPTKNVLQIHIKGLLLLFISNFKI